MGAVYALSGSSTSLISASAPLLLGVTTTAETGSVYSGCMAKTAPAAPAAATAFRPRVAARTQRSESPPAAKRQTGCRSATRVRMAR